ncbi:MAG: 1-acylglycerol-3-phosphate O-acyltransferase [Deltaproteobacteria bacterium]|nr:1-acylglycerol-3-phosphate O-acyltransferase [Deltaproteobacteria bacterium]
MKILNLIINIFFWTFFVISSTILVIGAAFIRVLTISFDPNLKILQQYSCFWASLYIWINPFWSATILGKKNVDSKKVYVMVSNHQSMADILILFRTFLHFKWVSKKSLFKTPLLGWNMALNGYIPIERGDAESRDRCLNLCADWIRKGSSVFFFPEGTRSPDGTMRPFKAGAFRLALQTGTDVLPMVIRGSKDAIPKHSIRLHGQSKMELEILPPISIKDFDPTRLDEESKRLAELVFQRIQEN